MKFNNLSVGYGHKSKAKIVAQNLSATIHSGELVCLLGANGTGKSTLLRTLCGFQPFFEGEVNLMEKDLQRMDEKEISFYLSVVLTDRVIVPNATVRELVAYGRSPHTGILGRLDTEDHKLIVQSMEQCGILHKSDELLSNLSDGERQKHL
ncbi:MAG: ABC transporter ATP-binding protein [Bacteroidales bacterium]|nr:ABC transporter ATP-binding protein [Bacteroidales bacterium]